MDPVPSSLVSLSHSQGHRGIPPRLLVQRDSRHEQFSGRSGTILDLDAVFRLALTGFIEHGAADEGQLEGSNSASWFAAVEVSPVRARSQIVGGWPKMLLARRGSKGWRCGSREY